MNYFLALASALTVSMTLATSTIQDAERAANAIGIALDGLVMICPVAPQTSPLTSRCVSSDLSPSETRRLLSDSSVNLYGAWHTYRSPNDLYNWILTSDSYLNIVIMPDSRRTGKALVVVGVPSSTSAAAPAFHRSLRMASARMNGDDIRVLQNRLMDVSKTARGQGGDGWYGPVTEANVMVFQTANGLRPTGIVDQKTWTALFSSGAKYFDAKLAEAMVKGRK